MDDQSLDRLIKDYYSKIQREAEQSNEPVDAERCARVVNRILRELSVQPQKDTQESGAFSDFWRLIERKAGDFLRQSPVMKYGSALVACLLMIWCAQFLRTGIHRGPVLAGKSDNGQPASLASSANNSPSSGNPSIRLNAAGVDDDPLLVPKTLFGDPSDIVGWSPPSSTAKAFQLSDTPVTTLTVSNTSGHFGPPVEVQQNRNGTVKIIWPSDGKSYVLEASASPSSTSAWAPVVSIPPTSEVQPTTITQASNRPIFYRVKKGTD